MNKNIFVFFLFLGLSFAFTGKVIANNATVNDLAKQVGSETTQTSTKPSAPMASQTSAQEQEAALAYVIELTNSGNKSVDLAKLQPLLNMANLNKGKQLDITSKKYGDGVFVNVDLPVSMNKLVQFAFNPEVPAEIIFPSAIRYGYWLPGSDILNLSTPLWKTWGSAENPLVLHGEEFEELTPNTDSGSYYSYTLKRLLVAFVDSQGKKVLLAVSMQNGPSKAGRKSFIVGDDKNWNYVYSNETGTNLSGIGWVEPIVYDSLTLNLFIEKEPGASVLENAVFKWIDAGWSGINMVKRSHVQAGIDRYLAAFKEVLAYGNVQEITAEKKRLESLTQEQRLQEFFPYARFVQEQSLRGSMPDAYKDVVKDGAYGSSMSPEQLISQMLKNHLRKSMNKVDSLELPSPNEEKQMTNNSQ